MRADTETKTEKIAALLAGGMAVKDIAKKGFSAGLVYQVKKKTQNGHAPGSAIVEEALPIVVRAQIMRGERVLGTMSAPLRELGTLLNALGDSK